MRYVPCDARDGAALALALAGATEIVDLSYASAARATFSDPLAELLVNVPVSLAVMQAALALGLRRYVYVSSGGTVYGEQAVQPITEAAVPAPVSPYGITKLTIERYALLEQHHHGLPAVLLRPGNAYGPEQKPFTGQGFIATAVGSVLARKPITVFGARGTVRDYIHVDDVASAIVAALDLGVPGSVYNVGTGIGMDNADILELVRAVAEPDGFRVPCEFAPARPADVTANVLDASALQRVSGWRPRIACAEGIREVWRAQRSRPEA
ncbi:NAD-dependent epimerase/dehydratase family protein [Ramlibacter montanisoli]|uniref:NAD-dependent epimerase/dehydratase family protein n=1 Tax=Ramlibacter montanisoli TaxID=2732512 RepID=A0A849KF98_9BURK|nr:NAD-dependent epimerase/dehydratase family protein [Ramlibacter montanisoli]NNU44146.1 NAD-dependent epimerase/dehydratase family protein [Ramlibacter montanisoli]